MRPRLVFVHGIGGPRDPARELGDWTRWLAEGMREAGHAGAARALVSGEGARCTFAHYGDLFGPAQAQGAEDPYGGPGAAPGEASAAVDAALAELLVAWVEGLAEEADEDEHWTPATPGSSTMPGRRPRPGTRSRAAARSCAARSMWRPRCCRCGRGTAPPGGSPPR